MNEIISILQDINPDVDYTTARGLVKDRLISSLELIMLITELSDAFEIEISPEHITPENFDSAETIYDLVMRVQDGE